MLWCSVMEPLTHMWEQKNRKILMSWFIDQIKVDDRWKFHFVLQNINQFNSSHQTIVSLTPGVYCMLLKKKIISNAVLLFDHDVCITFFWVLKTFVLLFNRSRLWRRAKCFATLNNLVVKFQLRYGLSFLLIIYIFYFHLSSVF